ESAAMAPADPGRNARTTAPASRLSTLPTTPAFAAGVKSAAFVVQMTSVPATVNAMARAGAAVVDGATARGCDDPEHPAVPSATTTPMTATARRMAANIVTRFSGPCGDPPGLRIGARPP